LHKIVQALGLLSFAAGLLTLILSALGAPPFFTLYMTLAFSLPAILSGAVMVCFAQMVQHLSAVQDAAEEQVSMLRKMRASEARERL
jgi:hypothetical protein